MMAKILSQMPNLVNGLWVPRAVENGQKAPKTAVMSPWTQDGSLENAANYYSTLSSTSCFPRRGRDLPKITQFHPSRFHLILCLMITHLGRL